MNKDIVIAAVAALPPTLLALSSLVVSLGNRQQLRVIHVSINSRLTQLLSATERAAHSEGVAVGANLKPGNR